MVIAIIYGTNMVRSINNLKWNSTKYTMYNLPRMRNVSAIHVLLKVPHSIIKESVFYNVKEKISS